MSIRSNLFIGVITVVVFLSGCASGSQPTREVTTKEEIATIEPERLITPLACELAESRLELFTDLMKLVNSEMEDFAPRKKRIQSIGSEIVEVGTPLLTLKAEDDQVEKALANVGGDVVAFGQALVDGYDIYEDDEPTDAIEGLQLSLIRYRDVCGL